jgi:hypothetical protein
MALALPTAVALYVCVLLTTSYIPIAMLESVQTNCIERRWLLII